MADQNTSTNGETNTSCPSTIDSPELQDKDIWSSYDNTFGKYAFHGGMEGYLENKDPSPESPQQGEHLTFVTPKSGFYIKLF